MKNQNRLRKAYLCHGLRASQIAGAGCEDMTRSASELDYKRTERKKKQL